MHTDPLLQILILLAASVFVVAGVRKLALPAILGYLAVGMLLGPHALALVVDNDTTRLLADIGVAFLVFTLGLEFSLPRLLAMRGEVLGVGGAQVLVTTAIVALAAVWVLGVTPTAAVVVGGAVAKLLLRLAEERGSAEGGGRTLDLHLTQSDLANMVGGSRQSVNQVLNTFERLGYLELDGRRIVIRKPELLQRRAGQSD